MLSISCHLVLIVNMPLTRWVWEHTGAWESHLHCLHVRGQSCQSNIQSFSHRENLLEVCGHHLRLNPKPPVRSNGHAILPLHGHYGPTVIRHNRLEKRRAGTAGAGGSGSGCRFPGEADGAWRYPPPPGLSLRPRCSGGKPTPLPAAVLALIFPFGGGGGAPSERVAYGRCFPPTRGPRPPRPGLREGPWGYTTAATGKASRPPAGLVPPVPTPPPGRPRPRPGAHHGAGCTDTARPRTAPPAVPHTAPPRRCSRLPPLPIGYRRGLPASRRSVIGGSVRPGAELVGCGGGEGGGEK